MLKRIQNKVTNASNDLQFHDAYWIYLGWSLLEPLISRQQTPDKQKNRVIWRRTDTHREKEYEWERERERNELQY